MKNVFPTVEMVAIDGGEKPFQIGKYQVTQALWEVVMGENPSHFKGENRPVENVSWDEAKDFIKKLNKETGKGFRLPTEAEWEFAARGGIYSQGYDYCGSDKLKQVGWYDENSNNETHDVGLLLANELGIHDMSGNVWEWCEDKVGNRRVQRGGSYVDNDGGCRPSIRDRYSPGTRDNDLGFRLAL